MYVIWMHSGDRKVQVFKGSFAVCRHKLKEWNKLEENNPKIHYAMERAKDETE